MPFTLADLAPACVVALQLKQIPMSSKQLAARGVGLSELRTLGFRLDGVKWVGVSLEQLFDADVPISECTAAGTFTQLQAVGFRLEMLVAAFDGHRHSIDRSV